MIGPPPALRRVLRALVFAASALGSGALVCLLAAKALAAWHPERGTISEDLTPLLAKLRKAMRPRRGEERVLLIGDSVLGWGASPPPAAATEAALRRARVHHLRLRGHTIWWPGWAITGEYCVADELLDLKPDRIVLEVNLRALGVRSATAFGYPLAGYVRSGRFLEALGLPLAAAGITANRLLFHRLLVASGLGPLFTFTLDTQARLLNLREGAERSLEHWSGVHSLDHRKAALFTYGLSHYHVPGKLRERLPQVLSNLGSVLSGVDESYPPLQTLGVVVRRFAGAGTRPLVWIAPVNLDYFRSLGLDVGGLDRSVAAIRGVVERNGGAVLDLHALLRDAQLLDAGDHPAPDGVDALARRLTAGVLATERP